MQAFTAQKGAQCLLRKAGGPQEDLELLLARAALPRGSTGGVLTDGAGQRATTWVHGTDAPGAGVMGLMRSEHRSASWAVRKALRDRSSALWLQTNYRERNTVLVAGSPRSGTTWLGNCVAGLLGARRIFEPFVLGLNRQLILTSADWDAAERAGALDRNHQLYLRPMERGSCHEPSIKAILQGRVRYPWVDLESTAGLHSARVVKAVRANLLLGFIARRWPSVRILFIVRSPFEVVRSTLERRERGWVFDWQPAEVLGQPALVTDHLREQVSAITAAKDAVDRLAHKWCIETVVPARQLAGLPNVMFVKYESLAREPREWLSVLRFLRLQPRVSGRAFRLAKIRSRTAGEAWGAGPAQGRNTAAVLTPEEVGRIGAVLATYGLQYD